MVPSPTEHLYTAARQHEPETLDADPASGGPEDDGRRRGWGWFAAVVGVSVGLWALVIWGVASLARLL